MQHLTSIAFALVGLLVFVHFARGQDDAEQEKEPPTFETWAIEALSKKRADSGRSYLSFLERSSLTCGVYHLVAGARDGQSPHAQDEVYYVLSGKSKFTSGAETVDVVPGDVLFVAAKEEHRFHDITEDLDLLVFFSTGTPMTDKPEEDD